MATMTDDERDAFMLEPRLGNLGEELGTAYAETNWALDDVMVSITPERWRTEVLG